MERRNHARVAVNLKAALLDDQAMPTACRVRDVSKGGMLLQREHHDNATTYRQGDTVNVRLSLRQADESKVIPLSTTVTHVEENSVGVKFLQPQSKLMELVEPYRLDKEDVQEAAVHHDWEKATAEGAVNPPSINTNARARRRRFAIQRARAQFAETMNTAHEPVDENSRPAVEQPPAGTPVTGNGNRALFYIGLLSLIAAVGILLFDFSNRTQLENRMSGLESGMDQQVSALTMLRARLTPMDSRTTELSELNARMDTLAISVATLETRILQETVQAKTVSTSTPEVAPGDTQAANDKTAAAAQTQPQGIGSDNPWIINLLTLYDKASANQFMEKARAQGIRADTNQVSVQGQPVWRVQVSGFSTRDEASAYGDISREKLGLGSIWIYQK